MRYFYGISTRGNALAEKPVDHYNQPLKPSIAQQSAIEANILLVMDQQLLMSYSLSFCENVV